MMLINIYYEAVPSAITSLLLTCKDNNIIFVTSVPKLETVLVDTIYLHVVGSISVESVKRLIALYHPYYNGNTSNNNNNNNNNTNECELLCNNIVLPFEKYNLELQFNNFDSSKFRKYLDNYINKYKNILENCLFTSSSLNMEERLLSEYLIISMGGRYTKNFTSDVTHLIVTNTDSKKYDAALKLKLQNILTMNFLIDCCKDLIIKPVNDYKLKPLKSLRICLSGFQMDEKLKLEEIINKYGGQYIADFDQATSCLVASNSNSEKFQYAIGWNVPVVKKSFLENLALTNKVDKYAAHSFFDSKQDLVFDTLRFTSILEPEQNTAVCYKIVENGGLFFPSTHFVNNPNGLVANVLLKIKDFHLYPSLATLHSHFSSLGVFAPFSNLNFIVSNNINAVKNWWTYVINASLTSANIPTMNFNTIDVTIPVVSLDFIEKCINENSIVELKSHLLRNKDNIQVKDKPAEMFISKNLPTSNLLDDNPIPTILTDHVAVKISNSFYFNFTFLISPAVLKEINESKTESIKDDIAKYGGLCYTSSNVKWDVLLCKEAAEGIKSLKAKKLVIDFPNLYKSHFITTPAWFYASLKENTLLDLFSNPEFVPTPSWGLLSNKKQDVCDPPKYFKISTSGFNANERCIIASWFAVLDDKTGAKYNTVLTRDTAYLVVPTKPDINSKKYTTALEWGIKIVYTEWLFNCIMNANWGFPNELSPSKSVTTEKSIDKLNIEEMPKKLNVKHTFSTSLTDSLNQALRVHKPINMDQLLADEKSIGENELNCTKEVEEVHISKKSKKSNTAVERRVILESIDVRSSLGKLGDNLQESDELRVLKLLTSSQDTIPDAMEEDMDEKKLEAQTTIVNSTKPNSPYIRTPITRALRETPSRIQNVINIDDKKYSSLKDKKSESSLKVNFEKKEGVFVSSELNSALKVSENSVNVESKSKKKVKLNLHEEKVCEVTQLDTKPIIKVAEVQLTTPTLKVSAKSKSTPAKKVIEPAKSGPIIALSGFRSVLKADLDKDISKLGGELLVNDETFVTNCDYLIVNEPIRSEKMFLAIITRKPILQKEYIQACKSNKRFIDFTPYLYSNMEKSSYEIIEAINYWTLNSSCKLPKELNCKQSHEPTKYCNMFNGLNILCCLESVKLLTFSRILKLAGATFHDKFREKVAYNCALIDLKSEEDLLVFDKLKKKSVLCLRSDFITDFITKCGKVTVESYLVNRDDFQNGKTDIVNTQMPQTQVVHSDKRKRKI